MKQFNLILSLCFALTTSIAFGQLCTEDNRFINPEYFSTEQIETLKEVSFGKALNYKNESIDLQMDIYMPSSSVDKMTKRPVVLLIHGGGFHSGHRNNMDYQCKQFAKRGFVAATMSYRLGFDRESQLGVVEAVYRAQQDANAALRYMVANAEILGVEPSWIFLGGSSAGAITSLFTSYASQNEWNLMMPQFETKIGAIDASEHDLSQTFSIKGVINHSGAIPPFTVKPTELIPTVSFHGEADEVVFIDKHPLMGIGSRPIHDMLNEAGVCNDFTIVPGGGHGIYYSQEGQEFRVERAANFFRSLFCDGCESETYSDLSFSKKQSLNKELFAAIKSGDTKKLDEIVRIEDIDKCHDINGASYNCLAMSIKLESLESLKYFVNKKADVERECTGKTPLMYAAKYGQLEAVKYLLSKGADPNASNGGKTAQDYAENYEHVDIKSYLDEYDSKE